MPPVLVVCNMTPVPRHGYRIGVPRPGRWREIANTDSRFYGGSDLGNDGGAVAPSTSPRTARPQSRAADPAAARHGDAARGGLSMAWPDPDRLAPGSPYPLGATWDGLGTNFAVFSAHAERDRALPVRSVGPARDRALPAAGMHRRGLARLPAQRAAPACSTAIAPTGRTSRSTAIASTRTSCCSIPMPGASPASCAGPMRCTAIG